MPKDYDFEIWQDDMMVAKVSAPRLEDACREAWHYAMVYGQDGPVQIRGDHTDKLFAAVKETAPALPA